MKQSIRSQFFKFLRWIGVWWLWRLFHQDHLVILTIHGVMDYDEPSEWVPLRCRLSIERLEEGLRLLAKHYHFISLADAVDMLRGVTAFRPHCLVLTFDDGYRNNLTFAWPVLQRLGIPAAIFPTVGNVEQRQPFWFDRLDYAMQLPGNNGTEVVIGKTRVKLQQQNRSTLRKQCKELIVAAKSLPGDDLEIQIKVEEVIEKLEQGGGHKLAELFETDGWSAMLSWQDMQKMSTTKGISIGSHTLNHVRLNLVSDDTKKDQLIRSKNMLEQHLEVPCEYLCYPNGDYDDRTMEITSQLGFKAALSSDEGVNKVGDNTMCLRRFHFPQTGDAIEALAVGSSFSYAVHNLKSRIWALLQVVKKP